MGQGRATVSTCRVPRAGQACFLAGNPCSWFNHLRPSTDSADQERDPAMIRQVRHGLSALMIATLAGVFGCGSSGQSGTLEACPAIVGMPCTSNSACEACTGGYCLSSGVCSRPCSEHADCGCPTGTINMDIAAGKCIVACGQVTTNTSACVSVCEVNNDCLGSTSCKSSGTDYGICK